MKAVLAVFSMAFGCWIGIKMEEWAFEKIWNLEEDSLKKRAFIRFQQWTAVALILIIYSILAAILITKAQAFIS